MSVAFQVIRLTKHEARKISGTWTTTPAWHRLCGLLFLSFLLAGCMDRDDIAGSRDRTSVEDSSIIDLCGMGIEPAHSGKSIAIMAFSNKKESGANGWERTQDGMAIVADRRLCRGEDASAGQYYLSIVSDDFKLKSDLHVGSVHVKGLHSAGDKVLLIRPDDSGGTSVEAYDPEQGLVDEFQIRGSIFRMSMSSQGDLVRMLLVSEDKLRIEGKDSTGSAPADSLIMAEFSLGGSHVSLSRVLDLSGVSVRSRVSLGFSEGRAAMAVMSPGSLEIAGDTYEIGQYEALVWIDGPDPTVLRATHVQEARIVHSEPLLVSARNYLEESMEVTGLPPYPVAADISQVLLWLEDGAIRDQVYWSTGSIPWPWIVSTEDMIHIAGEVDGQMEFRHEDQKARLSGSEPGFWAVLGAGGIDVQTIDYNPFVVRPAMDDCVAMGPPPLTEGEKGIKPLQLEIVCPHAS